MSLGQEESAQLDFGLGKEFLESAKTLYETPNQKWLPIYFLLCRSLELYLKSYLRFNGYNDDQLKKFGHNLCDLLQEAEKIGIIFDFSDTQQNVFRDLFLHHQSTSLRYRDNKSKNFPPAEDAISLIKRVELVVFDEITRQDF